MFLRKIACCRLQKRWNNHTLVFVNSTVDSLRNWHCGRPDGGLDMVRRKVRFLQLNNQHRFRGHQATSELLGLWKKATVDGGLVTCHILAEEGLRPRRLTSALTRLAKRRWC
ncbi:hypothetical protein OK016_04105 [Vibrio chagasii]|nr:hypothetical protein [Vibrio chagasii]